MSAHDPKRTGYELNADGQPCDADPRWIWICLFLDLVAPAYADHAGYHFSTTAVVVYAVIFCLPQIFYVTRLPSRYVLLLIGVIFAALVAHVAAIMLHL